MFSDFLYKENIESVLAISNKAFEIAQNEYDFISLIEHELRHAFHYYYPELETIGITPEQILQCPIVVAEGLYTTAVELDAYTHQIDSATYSNTSEGFQSDTIGFLNGRISDAMNTSFWLQGCNPLVIEKLQDLVP